MQGAFCSTEDGRRWAVGGGISEMECYDWVYIAYSSSHQLVDRCTRQHNIMSTAGKSCAWPLPSICAYLFHNVYFIVRPEKNKTCDLCNEPFKPTHGAGLLPRAGAVFLQ